MTLLTGEGSDYDYSALSCASDTSINQCPFTESEAVKGTFYQRAQLISPGKDIYSTVRPGDRKHHVIINVGGIKYLLPWTTLEDFPLTRLGQLKFCTNFDEIMSLCDDYDVTCNEFFFDRNPGAFRTIMTFLRVGKLRMLREVCALSFQEELLYWGIEEDSLDWCCKRKYLQKIEEFNEMYKREELTETDQPCEVPPATRLGHCMGKLRDMVERPQSGLPGKIFACLSVLFVTITAVNLSISTMPALDKVGLVLRILRALRILYVMRLARHSLGLQTLGLTARRCTREFGLLLLFLCVAIALFSPLLYLIENEMSGSQDFTSIPACYWWAVITMTTVGYGDMVPRSIPGQVVALSSILSGILLMAFPVTSIFHTFSRSYIELKQKQQRDMRRRTHFLFKTKSQLSDISLESDILFHSVSSEMRDND